MANYPSLNNSLENAMATTLTKWDRQDKLNSSILPSEVSSLLLAFLSLIKAYYIRVGGNTESRSDFFGTTG